MDDFKPLELCDKAVLDAYFSQDPPQISELTFTNLFMWRARYCPVWREWKDHLLIVVRTEREPPFGLPPTGTGDKAEALDYLTQYLGKTSADSRICRVDRRVVEQFVDPKRYEVMEDRDNSDYVYLAEELINLPGNRFHGKKNHVNKFMKNYEFEYRNLDDSAVKLFLDLQESWCELRDCQENESLLHEDWAVFEALKHHDVLGFAGGGIFINSKVEAFALGEMLNPDTAVIHIEKANPEIPGLYAVINQMFCKNAWSHVQYVNREQDLGVEGLRKAKLSYHPHHMVDKFTVIRKA